MQLEAIIGVGIGLLFTWIVLSIATMEIQNWISDRLDIQAAFLEESILEMFTRERFLLEQFYDHPTIKGLCRWDKNGRLKKPSYIPNDVFTDVTLEILLNDKEKIRSLNPEMNEMLDRLLRSPQETTGELGVSFGLSLESQVTYYRKNIERWYDRTLSQASFWYRRNALMWAFGIGLVLAVTFNIDMINITEQLWRGPVIREALAAQLQNIQLTGGTANISEIPGYLDTIYLPVGWTSIPAADISVCRHFTTITAEGSIAYRAGNECRVMVNIPPVNDLWGWVIKLLGLVISAFAARQGAPFWFDLTRKLVNVRSPAPRREEARG